MLRPKKNSHKEFDDEKKFLRLEIPLPPHNFSNGPSLSSMILKDLDTAPFDFRCAQCCYVANENKFSILITVSPSDFDVTYS